MNVRALTILTAGLLLPAVATLDGTVKEGETVTLTSEGSDTDTGFSWNLKVMAKVAMKAPQ